MRASRQLGFVLAGAAPTPSGRRLPPRNHSPRVVHAHLTSWCVATAVTRSRMAHSATFTSCALTSVFTPVSSGCRVATPHLPTARSSFAPLTFSRRGCSWQTATALRYNLRLWASVDKTDDTAWRDVQVQSNELAAEDHHLLTVQVSDEILRGYRVPGQWVMLRPDAAAKKASFFAISSPPPPPAPPPSSSATMELLVKRVPNSEWLCELRAGAKLDMSEVGGEGFPTAMRFNPHVKHVLLFATGSGIAPIRAVIEDAECLRDKESITLYYGCRHPQRMAYRDRFERWQRQHRVRVVPVFSQPPRDWAGARGYVQDALEQEGIQTPVQETGAVLCGMRDMTWAVERYLVERGVAAEAVLYNY
ncbi:hypothetical protein CDCA_CDCA11G3212 [Cyanidium caldarium]|uniref:FAD-binding FR-type domain-containing protein n=1 Tax=Cyanidium caldarium TaxID=2771 RepID=A0AAV9IY31_CYACA|nr:hypothetical protein CDCA_CDCA11G3212 [Cyanidium caldarium]